MTLARSGVALIAALASIPAAGQPTSAPPNPASVDVPVALALDDIRHAYALAPAADEVQIRVRTITGPSERDRATERSDSFRVFTDPDPAGHALKRVRLEMGALIIYIGDGRVTAVSSAVPDKYYQAEFAGPITAALIAERLPPLPAPELLFAASPDAESVMSLPPYLRGIRWSGALARPTAKPPYVTIVGASNAERPVGMVVNAETGRLLNFSAEWPRPEARGSTTIELTIKAIEPGSPAGWAIDTAGRTRVNALDALRPAAPKADAPPQPAGQPSAPGARDAMPSPAPAPAEDPATPPP